MIITIERFKFVDTTIIHDCDPWFKIVTTMTLFSVKCFFKIASSIFFSFLLVEDPNFNEYQSKIGWRTYTVCWHVWSFSIKQRNRVIYFYCYFCLFTLCFHHPLPLPLHHQCHSCRESTFKLHVHCWLLASATKAKNKRTHWLLSNLLSNCFKLLYQSETLRQKFAEFIWTQNKIAKRRNKYNQCHLELLLILKIIIK